MRLSVLAHAMANWACNNPISTHFVSIIDRLGSSAPAAAEATAEHGYHRQGQSGGGGGVLNPPDSLHSLQSRLLYFYSFCCLFTGLVWLSICVALYAVGTEYHVMNVLYESRWSPCTIMFTGAAALLLVLFKRETYFIACGVASTYACSSCLVTMVVYALDFHKALYQLHPPISSKMAGTPRRKYLQLSACMIVVSLLGFLLSVLLLLKLHRVSGWYYSKFPLNRIRQSGYLVLSALVQFPLIWFSIYASGHVISLPFSYVHQYMIQELLCALTLQIVTLIQAACHFSAAGNSAATTTNKLNLKLLLFLNGCQTVQEIFYTWNSYYISLYIHTSKAKLASGARTDQYLMSANFAGHFARMCVAAYTTYRLSVWLNAPFIHNAYFRVELGRRARWALIALAATALCLAACHVILDVAYTVTAHVYRTLIAFTGISVFYLSLIGVCLALFVRTGHTLLMIITTVIVLLLSGVSIHALYIYLDTSFHNTLMKHLETMGARDRRESTYMHFAEACMALVSLAVCAIAGVLSYRILHIDSYHDRRDGRLRRPLLILFALGIFQLELTAINAALIVSVKDESKVFQSMLAYGVLDSISMGIMCLSQIYISRPFNNHVSYGLTALLLFLTCETLTTFNYLSTKTTYVQLLIVFNRMFSASGTSASLSSVKQVLMSLFPSDDVGLMVAAHVVQIAQWILTGVSLVLTGLTLEMLYEQRRELTSGDGGQLPRAAANCPSAAGNRHREQRVATISTSIISNATSTTATNAEASSSSSCAGELFLAGDTRSANVIAGGGRLTLRNGTAAYENPVCEKEEEPSEQQEAEEKREEERELVVQQKKKQELLPESTEFGKLLEETRQPVEEENNASAGTRIRKNGGGDNEDDEESERKE